MIVSPKRCSSGALLIILFCLFPLAGFSQKQEPEWYKGNLHAHSYWSDGLHYPEYIMKWYSDHQYDFAVLSEHNLLAEGEKWIEAEKGTADELIFLEYLDIFGEDWVEYEEQEESYKVRLKTMQEYSSLFEEDDLLVIQSEEITEWLLDGVPVHINAANIQQAEKPKGGSSVAEAIQANLDALQEQQKQTGAFILPHLNHPNFGWAVTSDDYKQLEGARFFEVFNGHPLVNNRGDAIRQGTEDIWDEVNTHYQREGKPLLYGIAVDDTHNYHEFDEPRANPGRGWVQVKSPALQPDSLVLAMERGDFYSSTGVTLQDIQFNGQSLSVEIEPEDRVNYTIQFIGTLADEPDKPGVVLEEAEGTSATYTFTGGELFVRANIISDRPVYYPGSKNRDVEMAWVQPVVPVPE